MFYERLRPFSQRARAARMQQFMTLMRPPIAAKIIDLGGQAKIWENTPAVDLTILNLPGIAEKPDQSTATFVEGDACAVTAFADRSFDIAFSNSVIEHVGDHDKQAAFAREVRRLGKSYWVQTPSRWFPIEAHCGMPFWWFYPRALRALLIERWRRTFPTWTEMVEGTRVLSKRRMRQLFPEAKILTERMFLIPKSYIAVSKPKARSALGPETLMAAHSNTKPNLL